MTFDSNAKEETPAEPRTKDQETQTFEHVAEMFTQTEEVLHKEAITQTNQVEYNEEDCQTDAIDCFDAGVQVGKKIEVLEVGTDPDQNMLEAARLELEQSLRREYEKKEAMRRKSLTVLMESSGQNKTGDAESPKLPPQTVRNASTKSIELGALEQGTLPHGATKSPCAHSFKDFSNLDYFLNRDPMQEFFSLTCQSIKLNSPHMNTICTIDTMQLYQRAVKMNIPFFKWQTWIEDFINKEFFRIVLMRSQ